MPVNKAKHTKDFTQILNAVLNDIRLSYGARGLMAHVLTHCDNWVFTGEEYFVTEKDKLSKVKSYLKELIQYGYLKRYQEKNSKGVFGKMMYIFYESPIIEFPLSEKPLTVQPSTENQITVENPNNSKIAPKTVLPLTDSPLTVQPLAENHILNNTNINNNIYKKEKDTNLDKIINSYSDDEELKDTICDFLKMRKSIKRPMTDRALKIMLNKLDKYGDTTQKKILILENSIENSWQGVFPLKEELKQKNENVNNNDDYFS